MMIADWLRDPSESTVDQDPLHADELLDEADEFEEDLAAEMVRKGAIEVQW